MGSLGHFVQEVALYWITYEITGSAMSLGILGLCSALPRLIFGALSGVYVDRYDRKLMLILVNLVSVLPIAIFLVIHAFGTLAFWHLLVLEILSGSIRAINPSAAQSILAELVPREHVMNAVSLYTVGFNIARTAGPSIGGVLILLIGIDGCYAVFGVTLILAGIGMLFIRTNKEPPMKREENFLREFKEGFNYVWHEPLILSSVIAAYTFAVFIVTYQSFLPVFAKDVLQVGPRGLGILLAAPGLGGIASLSFPRLRRRTLEPGHAALGHDHNHADLSNPLLHVANLLAVGNLVNAGRRRPSMFPDHQPRDHPDRSAAHSHGPGDERVQPRPRHALRRFHSIGSGRNVFRCVARYRADCRCVANYNDSAVLSVVGEERVMKRKPVPVVPTV